MRKLSIRILLYFLTLIIGGDCFSQSDSIPSNFYKKPEIGFGYGFNKFKGELYQDKLFNNPSSINSGLHFSFRKPISKNLGLEYRLLFSNKFTIEDGNSDWLNANVQTNLLIQNFNFSFSFRQLIYGEDYNPLVYPVLHAGIEVVKFQSYSDLFDADGNQYHYWSDGSIKDLSESDLNASSASLLTRDFIYETDLRAQNNDGLGLYSQLAVGFPIGLSAKVRLYKQLHLTLDATYHLFATDLIDDKSSLGIGSRKGNENNDQLLYTGITLSYDFSARKMDKEDAKEEPIAKNKKNKEDKELAKKQKEAEKLAAKEAKDIRKKAKLALKEAEKAAKKKQEEETVLKPTLVDPNEESKDQEEVAKETTDTLDKEEKESPKEEVVSTTLTSGNFVIFIGTYNHGVPVTEMNKLLKIKGIKTGKSSDGSIEFTAGSWDRSSAESILKEIKSDGFSKAYIIGDKQNVTNDLGSTYSSESSETEAPSVEEEDLSNVRYKIQIAAFKGNVDDSRFSNVLNLSKERLPNGVVRYYSGDFTSYKEALNHSAEMDSKGYKGAFIVPFKNGEKTTLNELGLGAARKSSNTIKAEPKKVEGDIIFKVQLGAFKEDVPYELLQKFLKVKDMSQLTTSEGLTRYTAGEFNNYQEAANKKQEAINQGVNGAFIISFYKGKLIPVQEAIELLK